MPRFPEAKTAVALSGGIDSLVSAFLLKQQGADVVGLHFITGFEAASFDPASGEQASGRNQAESISGYIFRLTGIETRIIDIREEFENRVIRYFTGAYQNGKTPNPCVVCNREIKFGLMLDHARSLGASRIATGHYARIGQNSSGKLLLQKGADAAKDQSYFLAMLRPEQLEAACFILGDKTKTEVRAIAAQNRLEPFYKKESQDICFIRNASCQDFLASRISHADGEGDIVDSAGNVIGRHHGLFRYTIGQRRGINCPAAQPYYVLDIDTMQNRLVVGFGDELYQKRCYVSDVNWIGGKPAGPIAVKTRIRYRHEAVESSLIPSGESSAIIEFEKPQAAVTPGQLAVCWQKDTIIAGGWIEKNPYASLSQNHNARL